MIAVQNAAYQNVKQNPIHWDIWRWDLVHNVISGNKFFKLEGFITEYDKIFRENDYKKDYYKGIISFGGTYSNHLLATAAFCAYRKIPFVACIRGYSGVPLTPTLEAVQHYGAKLVLLNKKLYKAITAGQVWKTKYGLMDIRREYIDYYRIPEGGYDKKGTIGIENLCKRYESVLQRYDYIILLVGSGTTFSGVKNALAYKKVIGNVVLKDRRIREQINILLHNPMRNDDAIWSDFHFGGFSKYNFELTDFIHTFYEKTKIPLDVVYTGKTAYAVETLIRKNYFSSDARILLIHTGGLQGNVKIIPELALQYDTNNIFKNF